MDGLEEKINKILSDPQAMESVMEMAKSFGGGMSDDSSEQSNNLPALSGLGGGGGLMDMMNGLDPKMLGKMMSLMGEYNKKDDKRTQLLQALKPYVKNDRKDKMDKAVQMMKIAKTAKAALSTFGGKDNV